MNHTPAPWTVRGCELVGESTVLATLHWHSGRNEANEADACLIAAAPQLLAALENLEQASGHVHRYGAQIGPQWTKLAAALINARAAITLATTDGREG